jgi:hypothetical protein
MAKKARKKAASKSKTKRAKAKTVRAKPKVKSKVARKTRLKARTKPKPRRKTAAKRKSAPPAPQAGIIAKMENAIHTVVDGIRETVALRDKMGRSATPETN